MRNSRLPGSPCRPSWRLHGRRRDQRAVTERCEHCSFLELNALRTQGRIRTLYPLTRSNPRLAKRTIMYASRSPSVLGSKWTTWTFSRSARW